MKTTRKTVAWRCKRSDIVCQVKRKSTAKKKDKIMSEEKEREIQWTEEGDVDLL